MISYGYYPDGTRKYLSYIGGGYSYAPLLQYGYRNDGRRDLLQINNGTSFGWTYTAAGRGLSQSDPLTGATIHPDSAHTIDPKREAPNYSCLYYCSMLRALLPTIHTDACRT